MDLPAPLQTLVYEYLAGKYTILNITYYTDMYGYVYKTVKNDKYKITRYYNRAGEIHRDGLPAIINKSEQNVIISFVNNGIQKRINDYIVFLIYNDNRIYGLNDNADLVPVSNEIPQIKEYIKSKRS